MGKRALNVWGVFLVEEFANSSKCFSVCERVSHEQGELVGEQRKKKNYWSHKNFFFLLLLLLLFRYFSHVLLHGRSSFGWITSKGKKHRDGSLAGSPARTGLVSFERKKQLIDGDARHKWIPRMIDEDSRSSQDHRIGSLANAVRKSTAHSPRHQQQHLLGEGK